LFVKKETISLIVESGSEVSRISKLKLIEPREKIGNKILAKYDNGYTVVSTFADNGKSIEEYLKDLLKIKMKKYI
jgi:hypothetical protein